MLPLVPKATNDLIYCFLIHVFLVFLVFIIFPVFLVFLGVRQRTQYYIRSLFQTGFSFSQLLSLSTGQIIPSALLL